MTNAVEGQHTAPDGTPLFVRSWPAADNQGRAVLLMHGVAEHSGRYAHVAEALNQAGCSVHSMDLRGHGKSPGRRSYVESYTLYLDDLYSYFQALKAGAPGQRWYVLGHSMGGALALAFTARHQAELAGMITSGAPAGLAAETPGMMKMAARVLVKVAPTLPFIELDAAGISSDPAVQAAYDSDPLNYRGKLPVRQGVELVALSADARAGLPRIQIPSLIMHGGLDPIVPPSSLDVIAREIGAADCTVKRYEGMVHEIFNEVEKARVLADVVAWLAQH